MYKRLFSFSNGHDFGLEFGKDFLQPKFLLYSLFSAFFLALPLNYRVAKKTYRIATGYYAEVQARRSYLRALRESPIQTIAFQTAETTSKYLDIPLWLAQCFGEVATLCIYSVGTNALLTLIFFLVLVWKMKK
jgi:hypothetical protein